MVGVEVAIILVLLGINAVLAASEIAIVSARKTRLRALADDGNEAAAQVLALNENPSAFLATIQVGITLAGFFSSAVGAVSLVEVLGAWLADSGVRSSRATRRGWRWSSSPARSRSSASSSANSSRRRSPSAGRTRWRSSSSGRSSGWLR